MKDSGDKRPAVNTGGSMQQPEGLARPYGLAAPVESDRGRSEARPASLAEMRCPSCGRNIALIWKWWDTFTAWISGSYRLIQCRRCGTRFVAQRKHR